MHLWLKIQVMDSSKTKFFLLVVLLSMFLITCMAFPADFSIMGYSEDDLKSQESLIDLFESWMAKHSRIYSGIEEKLRRFEIFKANLKHIDEKNKMISNYWLGLNEFADLSHEEFKNKYLGLMKTKRDATSTFMYENAANLPKSVDWRKKGAVTHVKNQGACGA